MATKDFEVQEDVWIGNIEQKPIDPSSAAGGAFRLKKGEKITSGRAREIGLLKGDTAAEEKAVAATPEDKAIAGPAEAKAPRRTGKR